MLHKAWSSIEEVPYCFSRSSVKFQGHTALKIVEFDPDWGFPDCYSSLNCPIVFQGHPSNFKVTRDNILPISTIIECFWTVNPVWIHQWIWNDAQSWTLYRRSALWFLAATKQLYKWYFPSVCLPVCPSVCHTFLTMFPSSYHHEIVRSYYQWPK